MKDVKASVDVGGFRCLGEFEELFKEHYAFLCLVALSVVGDEDLAKDIVQDFFVSCWQRKDCLTISSSFKAYASKAVKNLSYKALKDLEKNQTLIRQLGPKMEVVHQADIETVKEKNSILNWLSELPEARREIFIASVVHGSTYAEIAENKNISVNTVKTQVKRAYAFLRSKAVVLFSLLVVLLLR